MVTEVKLKIDVSLTDNQEAMDSINHLYQNTVTYFRAYSQLCGYHPMNDDESILLAYITTMKLSDAAQVLDDQGLRLPGKSAGQFIKVSQRDIVRTFEGPSQARRELVEFSKLVHRANKGTISFNELVRRTAALEANQ